MVLEDACARLNDELVEILAGDAPDGGAPDRGESERTARMIRESRGDGMYSDLLFNLTHLHYEPEEARSLWQAVQEHKYLISEKIGRNIGIRLAALDYFTNITGKLDRPRVVDPGVLDRLYRDATVDPLTQLANRRQYLDRLASEFVRSRRNRKPFTLVIFDLDNFKNVNDSKGHPAGDAVLQSVSKVIRNAIREMDLAARWGGEEFILLLPETSKQDGTRIAERIRSKIESEHARDGITLSAGIAAFPADGEDEASIFAFADRALYRAKAEGKNRVCLAPFERRTFERLDEQFHVKLSFPAGGAGDVTETTTADISGGGMRLLQDKPIEISNEVLGEIEIAGRTALFSGRVVHTRESGAGRVSLGVEFLEIRASDRELILSSCRNLLDRQKTGRQQ